MIDAAIARRIRLVGMDVDGTLTDGGLFIGAAQGGPRIELKRFDIQDGMGMKLLQRSGVLIALVTGRAGEAARLRAEELKVDEFVISGKHKLPAFTTIVEKHGVAWDESAFIGDDLIDIPIMERVALPVAVGNAVAEVKAVARHTTAAAGGHGAVREFAEALLKARGTWDDTVEEYVRERSEAGRG
jgi:3-deoxy-D-manno-octulosonate 8-phosphate phosphatase (KDO 8-P phosphatase)